MKALSQAFCFLVSFALVLSCSGDKTVRGELEIAFELMKLGADIQPSYQTVIWLEDQGGDSVYTLLVTEYLSYGGYNDSTICSSWSEKVDWDEVTDELFDAVTRATPRTGENRLSFTLDLHGMAPGIYRYQVQTHVIEGDNVLYSGEIELGSDESESTAQLVRVPVSYEVTPSVLNNVAAFYHPDK